MKLSALTRADDPGPLLETLRAQGPLARMRVPLVGRVWVTTTDAAARAVLKDPRFRRDTATVTGKPLARTYWWMPRRAAPLLDSMIAKDGGDHRRLRRLVDRAFARMAVADLRPGLAARADALLDGIDPRAAADLVDGYTRPLPFAAVADLLGLSHRVDALSRAVAPLSAVGGTLSALWALARMGRAVRLIRAEIAAARQAPRPGLLSALVAAEAEGDRLSEDELVAMVFTLFVAGHETTVHLLNAAILTLCDAPHLRERVRADGDARALFVEEVMRFVSPVATTKAHYASEALDVLGAPVAKGEAVFPLLLAANRDPARWDHPERFRSERRPNAHLGFGHGPHACLGMALARLEAEVGIERLLARFPDFALEQAIRPGWTRRMGIRAPDGLSIRLRPRGAR